MRGLKNKCKEKKGKGIDRKGKRERNNNINTKTNDNETDEMTKNSTQMTNVRHIVPIKFSAFYKMRLLAHNLISMYDNWKIDDRSLYFFVQFVHSTLLISLNLNFNSILSS